MTRAAAAELYRSAELKTLLFILMFAATACASLNSTAKIWPDATVCAAIEYPPSATKRIDIAKGIWIDMAFDISSKGIEEEIRRGIEFVAAHHPSERGALGAPIKRPLPKQSGN